MLRISSSDITSHGFSSQYWISVENFYFNALERNTNTFADSKTQLSYVKWIAEEFCHCY